MWRERYRGPGVFKAVRRPRSIYLIAIVFAGALTITLTVCGPTGPSVVAQKAWVDAAPAGDTAVVSMTLVNHDAHPVDIVDVLSSSARSVAIFQHVRVGDTVRTNLIRQLAIPAGTSSTFAPPGPHVMLAGLQHELREGDHVRVTVILADGRPVDVDAIVKPAAQIMATQRASLPLATR
jgi:periplasmic copper chaperone A